MAHLARRGPALSSGETCMVSGRYSFSVQHLKSKAVRKLLEIKTEQTEK
jgi:hypothetical protein